VNPKGPTTTVPFVTNGLYEVMIDTDGDNVVNLAYSVRFMTSASGDQAATLRRIEGTSSNRTGGDGEVIIANAPVTPSGSAPKIATAGDYRLFTGWRSDPFFFDAIGAINGLKFTGNDFCVDKNVSSIVLEVPNAKLGSANLRLWGRTVDGTTGTWVQADRGSHASQEPFLAADQKIAYITGEPANDAQFIPLFAHGLQHAGGYTPEGATKAAGTHRRRLRAFPRGADEREDHPRRRASSHRSAHRVSLRRNAAHRITRTSVVPD
jgi:Domain of unknown function (DUF4331)